MDNNCQLTARLLETYKDLSSDKVNMPSWAVHKRNYPDELVTPTIPFVGKEYAKQEKKILVYASAENLTGYWKGNNEEWCGDVLDDDIFARNRHRNYFDNKSKQEGRKIPFVHCGPLNDGGLLVAIMYLAYKLRNGKVEEPYSFYETIAFGNYGKFSIETEFQKAVRNNPQMSMNEKNTLRKTLEKRNEDYAGAHKYLKASHAYIENDISILEPDYIIMPSVSDARFLRPYKNKIINIYQINGQVINNMASENGTMAGKYSKYNKEKLPAIIKECYEVIKGINQENFLYLFDYLDKVYEEYILNK